MNSLCKDCNKEYQRKHYRRNKEYYKTKSKQYDKDAKQAYQDWKSTLKCKKCGFNHPAALDFHHRDPKDKEFTIAANKGLSLDTIKKEAEKCDVLCANCHRILHYDIRQ